MVSRIGTTDSAKKSCGARRGYGVGTDLIQVDAALPTGFVRVAVDDAGNPTTRFSRPARGTPSRRPTRCSVAQRTRAQIVFGTLAQRHAISRGTIERLWDTKALMVFDGEPASSLRRPRDRPAVTPPRRRREDLRS